MRLRFLGISLLLGLPLLSLRSAAFAQDGGPGFEPATPLASSAILQSPLTLILTPPPTSNPIVKTVKRLFGSNAATQPQAEGHQAWIDAINAAQTSIKMTMFHLTDQSVITALCGAAKRTGTGADAQNLNQGVHVILDRAFFNDSHNSAVIAQLKACGVQTQPSSPSFSISHEKAMVIDNQTSFITAMNMTTQQAVTRDFGIITHDTNVINEQISVFTSDWAVMGCTGAPTPGNNPDDPVVWSPVNSRAKLVDLINSSEPGTSLYCSTESLTDPVIEAAFVTAATKRGVNVQLLAPQCDENPDPALNIGAMQDINQRVGRVIAKVMPPGKGAKGGAGTAATPYIHSKMCLANYPPSSTIAPTDAAFVGSVNFSTDSTQTARELGIVFRNKQAEAQILQAYKSDWKQAIAPIASPLCPVPPKPAPPANPAPPKPTFPACGTTAPGGSPSTGRSAFGGVAD